MGDDYIVSSDVLIMEYICTYHYIWPLLHVCTVQLYITVYIVYLWYIIHFKTPNFPNNLLPISQNTK